MSIDKFRIESKLRTYDIHFIEDMGFLTDLSAPTLYIVDKNVWECYADGCLRTLKGLNLLLLDVSEEQKNLQTVQVYMAK
jgi:hypothetical protein